MASVSIGVEPVTPASMIFTINLTNFLVTKLDNQHVGFGVLHSSNGAIAKLTWVATTILMFAMLGMSSGVIQAQQYVPENTPQIMTLSPSAYSKGLGGGGLGVGNFVPTNGVSLYGTVDAALDYSAKVVQAAPASGPAATARRLKLDSGDEVPSSWGIKGGEDIGGGLSAFFDLEGGFSLATGQGGNPNTNQLGGILFGHYSYVGLAGSFGSLQFGRRFDPTFGIYSIGTSAPNGWVMVSRIHGFDRAVGNFTNNGLTYDSQDFGGFRFTALYALGGNAGHTQEGVSESIAVRFSPAGTPYSLGYAYFQSKIGASAGNGVSNTTDQNALTEADCSPTVAGHIAGSTCIEIQTFNAKYLLNNWLFRGSWSRTRHPLATPAPGALNLNTTSSGDTYYSSSVSSGAVNTRQQTVADVGLDCFVGRWRLSGSYIQSTSDFVGVSRSGKLSQYVLDAQYRFSARTDAYVQYGYMTASDMYNPGVLANGAPGADNASSGLVTGIRSSF